MLPLNECEYIFVLFKLFYPNKLYFDIISYFSAILERFEPKIDIADLLLFFEILVFWFLIRVPRFSHSSISDDFINNHIAGTSPGWIEVDTGKDNGALTVEISHFIDRLEQHIHQHETVNYSYSLARYVRRINYTLNDFNPEYNRLPEDVERFIEIDED